MPYSTTQEAIDALANVGAMQADIVDSVRQAALSLVVFGKAQE